MQATVIARGPPLRDPGASLPEAAFVRVTALAARILEVPVALVRTSGHGRYLSEIDARWIPGGTVAHVETSVVPATEADVEVLGDPARAADVFGLAFHASAPLTTGGGRRVGTFAIFDRWPRTMRSADRSILDDLAAVAAEELEVWLAAGRSGERERAIAEHRLRLIDDTDALMAAMRGITAYEDPGGVRPAICQIALSMSGADAAALYEIADDDEMFEPTAMVGAPWPETDAKLGDRESAVVRAFVGGKAVLVEADARARTSADDPGATPSLTFWQPFAAGGPTDAAVIGLAWLAPSTVAPVRLIRLMDSLAAEAMRAIERADLLLRLEDQARTDELTGLPNRRALNEGLGRELERARREGHAVCVGLLDLDHFKRYNDSRGHPAGDRLLADAAVRWREVLRGGTDILARYGGEEFVIVLPTVIEAAYETIERMRAKTPGRQTASVGLAQWDGDESAGVLLARADAALYAAKASGRDRIERAP